MKIASNITDEALLKLLGERPSVQKVNADRKLAGEKFAAMSKK